MKILFILILLCYVNGDGYLFHVHQEGQVTVIEGDLITLHTDVNTNVMTQQDDIGWYFNGMRIAHITRDQSKICRDVQCERFRHRLKLDHDTGSLTIMNTRNTDSGEYILQIRNIREKIFDVTVYGDYTYEQAETQSIKEGDSVDLYPGVIQQPDDVMKWYFNEILIAEITGDQSKICMDDQCDERFRDRLKLYHETGSLTIMNTRITDSGVYKFESNSTMTITRRPVRSSIIWRFNVTVTVLGLSSATITGIWTGVALLAVIVAAVYYCHRRI